MTASFRAFILIFLATPLLLAACDQAEEASGIDVIAYDGPPITPAMANMERIHWTASVEGGQVVLESHWPERDSSRIRLFLLDVPGALPAYTGIVIRLTDDGRLFRLRRGTIAIDAWDLDGVISGELRGQLFSPPSTYGGIEHGFFYVDRSDD